MSEEWFDDVNNTGENAFHLFNNASTNSIVCLNSEKHFYEENTGALCQVIDYKPDWRVEYRIHFELEDSVRESVWNDSIKLDCDVNNTNRVTHSYCSHNNYNYNQQKKLELHSWTLAERFNLLRSALKSKLSFELKINTKSSWFSRCGHDRGASTVDMEMYSYASGTHLIISCADSNLFWRKLPTREIAAFRLEISINIHG